MIPFISEAEALKRLDEKTAFRLAEETFRLKAAGRVQMPPKMYLTLPAGDDFRAMPASIEPAKGEGMAGIKWVSVFPRNPKMKLPTVGATILLNSSKTGELLAVVAANGITASRTAAAAAVATKYLARPRPQKLALVGAGLQAHYQLRALAALHPFHVASVWGFLPGEADAFCQRNAKVGVPLEPVSDIRACVADADVVVTCTTSRRPLVRNGWIKPGAHVNAIGADAKGKEELDPAMLTASKTKVVVDDWEQASHSGEINVPVSRGLFGRSRLHAELSEVVSGKRPGRTSEREITIFDSTGIAALDLRFATHVYRARR